MSEPVPVPEIAVYERVAGPAASRFLALFVETKKTKSGSVVHVLLPMYFTGVTEASARLQASSFWEREAAKEAAKKERVAKQSNPRARKVAA